MQREHVYLMLVGHMVVKKQREDVKGNLCENYHKVGFACVKIVKLITMTAWGDAALDIEAPRP
jgi:hypothetical protein